MELAIAVALAEYATRDTSHARFEIVDQLLGHGKALWTLFCARITASLRSNPTARAALVARLSAEPSLVLSTPCAVTFHSHVAPSELAERHNRDAAAREMWGSSFSGVRLLSSLEHRILHAADPVAWLRILERFTFPDPVLDLIEGACFETMGDIVVLLRAAAPAYDTEGNWRRERFVPFPLIAAAEQILQRLAGTRLGGPEADEKAFEAALDQLVSTLAGRPDFTWLGHEWLQQLAWQDRVQRGWTTSRKPGLDSPLWRVVSALASRLDPLEDAVRWIADEDATWRVDRLVAALAVPPVKDGEPGATLLATAIRRNLVTSSLMDVLLRNPDTTFARLVARALSEVGDAAEWFTAAWQDCFAARDCLRAPEGRLAASGHDPGALAVACACAALTSVDRHPMSPEAAAKLWGMLRKAVVENARTAPDTPDATFAVATRWLALVLGSSFEPGEERRSALASMLTPLRAPSASFVQLLADLTSGGVTVDEIDHAMGSPAAERLIDRAIADARGKASSDCAARETLAHLARLRQSVLASAGAR